MKRQIIEDITATLIQLQIPFSIKDDSNIVVSTEFYEIGYGTMSKKVMYDLSVYIDEGQKVVFMYAKTADQCLMSVDDLETSWPSASLFRTVKRLYYDEDGRPAIVDVDLGAVPNTIKDTACKYGWKFRTTISMSKPEKRAPIQQNKALDIEKTALEDFGLFDINFDQAEEPSSTAVPTPKKSGIFGRLFKKKSPKSRRK